MHLKFELSGVSSRSRVSGIFFILPWRSKFIWFEGEEVREMIHLWKVVFSLVLLLSVSTTPKASDLKDSFEECENTVKNWVSSSLEYEITNNNRQLRDLLFFLHIPRTGGRTYFHCFLKKLYANSMECPRSYDKLRFDPRKTNCRLLATHDDYSLISKLPKDRTSVVTIIRNPIDRVLSAYEFSLEVAARFLVHPNLTSAARMMGRIHGSSKRVSTLDIWPWKYLVPWMREDLFARREARTLRGKTIISGNDPYNMEDIVIPLHKYINDPIAQDIIQNGATFQVAGLTNNSYVAVSHHVRRCVLKYQSLGQYVLEVAKKRLDGMLYVGITENHKESAAMFANVVGAQVISQFSNVASTMENITLFGDSGEMTAEKLVGAYEGCMTGLRSSQAQRRTKSLVRISPANFTKEARRQIPAPLIQEIASLNSLDMELYEYAQVIFERQKNQVGIHRAEFNADNGKASGQWGGTTTTTSPTAWRLLCFASPFVGVSLFVFIFVSARQRSISKVKL